MTVRWTERAEDDLQAIVLYIAKDDRNAALRMQARLLQAADALSQMWERGRRGQVEGTRELVVAGTPYIVVYAAANETVHIVHIVHGAQLWPPRES